MQSPVLLEPPAVLPVSLEEARLHCRIDSTEEDPLLETLIAAATGHCDGYNGILARGLITQTWRLPVAAFPVEPDTTIPLPLKPVREITEVAYYDGDNVAAVMPPADYVLYTDDTGTAHVALAAGASWPLTYERSDAVGVNYVVGYGKEPHHVPAPIRQAILLMVGAWYDDRMNTAIPPAVDRLLTPFRPLIW